MNKVKAQRNYKDSIFRMLFKDKGNLLSLYNALNKTDYTDVNELEITTLENAVYMNYKNDVSFVFDFELMLYEHQSTINPNMPLRDLFYVTSILQKRIRSENLYGSKQIMIPNPRFVVFYNGVDSQPERQILKLSDAYEKKFEEGREAGLEEGEILLARVNKLYSILIDTGRIDDLKRATGDKAYQEQLMIELLPEEIQKI